LFGSLKGVNDSPAGYSLVWKGIAASPSRSEGSSQALPCYRLPSGGKILVRRSEKPLALVVSGAERHESRYVEALLTAGRVRRRAHGRPRTCPRRLVGDRGYSYPGVRRLLGRRHIQAVIPRRRDQRPNDGRHSPFDRAAYRERPVNRLKQHRRVATRYEKRAGHYVSMLLLAALLLWLLDIPTRARGGAAPERAQRRGEDAVIEALKLRQRVRTFPGAVDAIRA
jgi:hypothetical protein